MATSYNLLKIGQYHVSLEYGDCEDATILIGNKGGQDIKIRLADLATYVASTKGVDQLNDLVGSYEARPDIKLTALETGKVINAAGAKVAKSGWAVAEFTAQLGNVYLFNPGATASDVCVFAEKIDKVETRGISYAYTYDAKGNPLTAKATYNGVTHSYTYTNTYTTQEGGQESLSVVITDDQTGKTVEYLPQTYQTTVGAYQPMVRLNENAELPKDGYCRFVSNFQTSDSIRIAVSYKVDSADLTMKVVRSGMVASMCTQLSKINQKVDEAKAAIEVLTKEVSNMSNGLGMVGFCRVNGDVSCDPAADQVYGTKEMIHEIGKHFRLGLAKTNGSVADVKRMAPGRLTLGADGQKHAIDGTEGDVVLVFDDDVYLQKCTQMVNNVELNCMGVSMNAHSWHGHAAKHFKPFAISPHYTVNCKLDGDERTQAHVVWNRAAKGTMNAVEPILKATYKQAGGAHTQYVSTIGSIQMAQAKNTDPLTNRPWMSQYYEFYEIWAALLQIECGTLAHTRLNLFGTGDTPLDTVNASTWHDAQMSGNSGYKVVKADGTIAWHDINGYNEFVGTDGNKHSLEGSICGTNSYNPVDILEGQRFLDGLADAGLLDYLGDTSVLFTLTDEGVVTKVDGVNVETGEGMEACKHYYQARNVPGCEGMADGVMTAVVNSYTKLEFADGVTDLNGNAVSIAYMKRSMPIYRGKSLPYQGCFEQTYGAAYTMVVGDNADDISVEFRCASDVNNIPPLKTFGAEVYQGPSGTNLAMEHGLDQLVDRTKQLTGVEGWAAKCDYSLSLLAFSSFGGGARSRENAYIWLYKTNNAGVGKRQVHGSPFGCPACSWLAPASVRTAYWRNAAGYSDVVSAGALASYPVQIVS